MGIVVEFPGIRRLVRADAGVIAADSARVVILPVIRIDRYGDAPSDRRPPESAAGRRRRKRASRP